MLFKKTRSLNEKVFSTKISFVDFGERDALGAIDAEAKANEQALVDDFGAPIVSVGKEFVGHAKVESGKVVLVDDSTDPDAACVSYVLSEKKIDVTTGFEALFAINAKKECACMDKADPSVTILTPEQVAEAKCLVFEVEIEKRLAEVIDGLKAKYTAFETEELDEIAIPVPAAPNHSC